MIASAPAWTTTRDPEGVVTIEPVELRIALTYPSGGCQRLSLVENHDLPIGKVAGTIFRNAEGGQVAIAFDVDDDHDEVHYRGRGGSDAVETLTRGIECLTLALEATKRARQA